MKRISTVGMTSTSFLIYMVVPIANGRVICFYSLPIPVTVSWPSIIRIAVMACGKSMVLASGGPFGSRPLEGVAVMRLV